MIDTTHSYRDYAFYIRYLAHDPAYSVDFPDCPEIITSGATLSQAFANACEAPDLHLESCQKIGLPLPRPHHRLVVQAALSPSNGRLRLPKPVFASRPTSSLGAPAVRRGGATKVRQALRTCCSDIS